MQSINKPEHENLTLPYPDDTSFFLKSFFWGRKWSTAHI